MLVNPDWAAFMSREYKCNAPKKKSCQRPQDAWTATGYDAIKQSGISLRSVTPKGASAALTLPVGGYSTNPSTSEAMGYSMRNAVMNQDYELFMQLVDTYKFYTQQCTSVGLMPWCIDYTTGIVTGNSSATDADTDIIHAMLDALVVFPQLNTDDFRATIYTAITAFVGTQQQSDLQRQGCYKPTPGGTYVPLLAHDNWEDELQYPDYFDPAAFVKMANFLKSYSLSDPNIAILEQAKTNTLNYIYELSSSSGWWFGDQIQYGGDGAALNPQPWGPKTFAQIASAFRFLLRFSQFISDPSMQADPQMAKAKELLCNVMKNVLTQCEVSIAGNPDNPWVQLGSVGMGGAKVTSTIYLAICALLKAGYSNEDIGLSADLATSIPEEFNAEIQALSQSSNWGTSSSEYNSSNPNIANYYDMQLNLLSQGILQDYSLIPNSTEKPFRDFAHPYIYMPGRKCPTPQILKQFHPQPSAPPAETKVDANKPPPADYDGLISPTEFPVFH